MTMSLRRSLLSSSKSTSLSSRIPFVTIRHSQCRYQSQALLLSAHRQRSKPQTSPTNFSSTHAQAARRCASVLSSLSDNRGAYSKRIRRGRGPGSGKGKTSGRGHGGQKSRGKPPAGFEGGQTPLWKANGVKGFMNPMKEEMALLNLDTLQSWVDQGRLNPNRPITMLELHRSGCVSSVHDGIKLLSRGQEHLKTALHLIVSRASYKAIEAIEAAGGTVTTRFYSKFAIKNILRGKTDPINSRLFVATPITKLAVTHGKQFNLALPDPISRKELEYYRDVSKRGYLSYMVPVGQTPSLYFRTPGLRGSGKPMEAAVASGKENRLW